MTIKEIYYEVRVEMKSIIKILYHRISLIVAALLVQIAVLIAVFSAFSDYFVTYYWVNIALSIIVVVLIINRKSNPSYKIMWIIPVLIFPVFGCPFYLLLGGKRLSKKERKKCR